MAAPAIATQDPSAGAGEACLIRVKAVPGARRDEVSGRLGDRLKVRISVPPENGKANAAICEVLARALGLKPRDLEIVSGHTSAEKTVRALGIAASAVNARWQ